ncbi:SH3 domain-containing protein [Flagellimonas marinaquae]|nr:SH3 domain-containing protein [Allomuricauda aquimarina]
MVRAKLSILKNLIPLKNLSSNKLGIKTNLANVRSEPSTTSDILFQVQKGNICHITAQGESLVEINGISDRWYKVNFNGKEGWVFGYYTTKRRE